ncbi:hypothetical protein BST33_07775 [Mycolicibacter minnesotensis]|uniref:Uncharacterized protein n=1 Tax=Mycolicibacter minnesotensis TaxID=1118379 RepID=A0AA91M6H7_9MYCO|nr:hypothetical protein [Mycolicibacter minnesotensis]ORB02186.1 hypothetical protein BST33_07775 [Mycolicibacter minnesotensis]
MAIVSWEATLPAATASTAAATLISGTVAWPSYTTGPAVASTASSSPTVRIGDYGAVTIVAEEYLASIASVSALPTSSAVSAITGLGGGPVPTVPATATIARTCRTAAVGTADAAVATITAGAAAITWGAASVPAITAAAAMPEDLRGQPAVTR